MEYVIEMLGIRKEFPGIVANDNITLQLRERGDSCPPWRKWCWKINTYEYALWYVST